MERIGNPKNERVKAIRFYAYDRGFGNNRYVQELWEIMDFLDDRVNERQKRELAHLVLRPTRERFPKPFNEMRYWELDKRRGLELLRRTTALKRAHVSVFHRWYLRETDMAYIERAIIEHFMGDHAKDVVRFAGKEVARVCLLDMLNIRKTSLQFSEEMLMALFE